MDEKLDKERIIKEYFRELAMKSVEVQKKKNPAKMSEMGLKSGKVRRINAEKRKDILFCEKIIRDGKVINDAIKKGKLCSSFLKRKLKINYERANLIMGMIEKKNSKTI